MDNYTHTVLPYKNKNGFPVTMIAGDPLVNRGKLNYNFWDTITKALALPLAAAWAEEINTPEKLMEFLEVNFFEHFDTQDGQSRMLFSDLRVYLSAFISIATKRQEPIQSIYLQHIVFDANMSTMTLRVMDQDDEYIITMILDGNKHRWLAGELSRVHPCVLEDVPLFETFEDNGYRLSCFLQNDREVLTGMEMNVVKNMISGKMDENLESSVTITV